MYYNDQTLILLDGKFIKAKDACGDLYSQTLHYGLGVFEGIRAYDTPEGVQIFKAREHYQRLIESAKKMHLPLAYSIDELVELSYEVLLRNNLKDAYIRPLVFNEPAMGLMPGQKTHLMIAAWKWDLLYGNKLADLMISSYQRPNPKSVHMEAKVCGHYVNSILATQEAKSQGYNDAVMLDMNGNVAEAAGANIFYEKNEVLFTPPAGHILPGITRKTVIELARELGMTVVEKEIKVEELLTADGAFLTGTAAEVTGVRTIADTPMVMAWEDTLGFVLSRTYKQLVTRVDKTQGTFI